MEPLVFDGQSAERSANAKAGEDSLPARRQEGLTIIQLFEREESGLIRYALGLIGRRTVAEELVQDAFLRLHQVWAEVENPRGWLYKCLRNLALNYLRDRKDEAELKEDTVAVEEGLAAEILSRNEAVGTVRLLLTELAQEDRTLVELKYHHGLKYDQISKRTGLSVSNVGYRLHHVLKGLAGALRKAGIEGSQG
jgi:RNA polymerase sigma factor (sigma-70 family)